jgi:hypothetical protein
MADSAGFDWVNLFGNLGATGAVLGLLVAALRGLWVWMRPKLDRLFELAETGLHKHVRLIDTMQEKVGVIASDTKRLAETQEVIARQQIRMARCDAKMVEVMSSLRCVAQDRLAAVNQDSDDFDKDDSSSDA